MIFYLECVDLEKIVAYADIERYAIHRNSIEVLIKNKKALSRKLTKCLILLGADKRT